MRLDSYVAEHWPEFSRSQWKKFIELGYVTVDGETMTSAKVLLGEDSDVAVHIPKKLTYQDKTLPIIYEDENVIVIDKPSGILTHAKGEISEEFSVAEFVRPKTSDGVEGNRPGIVHRLDRDTSGIIVTAKTNDAKRHLQKQFQDRKAKKTYLAIVRGVPKLLEARIDLPIERNPKNPATFRIGASGKNAETFYKILVTKNIYTLLELKPTTGRTHQLRVHLAHIGTPIAGDVWYEGGKSPIGRLCLHASELEITLPGGDRRTFHADPPKDFQNWIES